jgi:hypothetical protein
VALDVLEGEQGGNVHERRLVQNVLEIEAVGFHIDLLGQAKVLRVGLLYVGDGFHEEDGEVGVFDEEERVQVLLGQSSQPC